MNIKTTVVLFATLLSTPLFATTFIVPEDAELVAKSPAIVAGHITGSRAREREGSIETIYQLRVERVFKGPILNGTLLDVTSLGGALDGRFTIVPGAAHFAADDRVLLFLTPYHGGWTPTDLVLGKFRFLTPSTGADLLVRDEEDIIGWDRDGSVHHERLRRETAFLRFIQRRTAGEMTTEDYFVDVKDVVAPRRFSFQQAPTGFTQQTDAAFPPETYINWFRDQAGGGFPARWPNMTAGVSYRKNATQNASGLSDGGVGVIQSGLAAWTNECGSAINLSYAGTTTALHAAEGINVVLFNDPSGNVPGSWTGAGTVAITFGQGGGFHTFGARSDWVSITDEDVVFQDGFPGTHPAMPTAMTHELGHSIGWRHSNAHWLVSSTGADTPCDPSVEECTTNAIMNATSVASLGYTLQTWDVNAAQAVYPGGSCTTPPPPPPSPGKKGDADANGVADVFWRHDAGENSLWLLSAGGGVNAVPLPTTDPQWFVAATGDFNADGRTDMLWRHRATNSLSIWYLNANSVTSFASMGSTDSSWVAVGTGDFDNNGADDILWRNSGGLISVWMMSATGRQVSSLPTIDTSIIFGGIGDTNGDGRDDIIWRRPSSGSTYLWQMTGTSVNALPLPSADATWTIAAVGDFGGDGKADLFWRRNDGINSQWQMNGNLVTALPMPTVPDLNFFVGACADFSGDGRADLFWRLGTTGQNYVWVMNGGSVTSRTMPTAPDTTWRIVGPK